MWGRLKIGRYLHILGGHDERVGACARSALADGACRGGDAAVVNLAVGGVGREQHSLARNGLGWLWCYAAVGRCDAELLCELRLIGLVGRYIRLGAARFIPAIVPPHEPIVRIGHRRYGRTIAAVGYLLGDLAAQRTAFCCGVLQGEGINHEGYIDIDVAAWVGHGDGVRFKINLIADVFVVVSIPSGYANVFAVARFGADGNINRRPAREALRHAREVVLNVGGAGGVILIGVVNLNGEARLECGPYPDIARWHEQRVLQGAAGYGVRRNGDLLPLAAVEVLDC